jgi:hypothetical protein
MVASSSCIVIGVVAVLLRAWEGRQASQVRATLGAPNAFPGAPSPPDSAGKLSPLAKRAVRKEGAVLRNVVRRERALAPCAV